MTISELAETLTALNTILTSLSGVLANSTGIPAANLKHAIDDLRLNADTLLRSASLGDPLWALFELAIKAGASVTDFEAVRTMLTAMTPKSNVTKLVVNGTIQMVLACETSVYAATAFTSNQDVTAAVSQINIAFGASINFAADNADHSSYQALMNARAKAVNDLRTRGRSLPKLVPYSFGKVFTSHSLSQRLYGTASRADELVAENKIINPAFCSSSGVALSS